MPQSLHASPISGELRLKALCSSFSLQADKRLRCRKAFECLLILDGLGLTLKGY